MLLYRSSDNRVLGGVCGGLAHKFNVNPGGLRLLLAVVTAFTLIPLLVYAILWTFLEERPTGNFIN